MKRLDTAAEVGTDAARDAQEPAVPQAPADPVRPGGGARASCSCPARSCSPTRWAAPSTRLFADASTPTSTSNVAAKPKVQVDEIEGEQTVAAAAGRRWWTRSSRCRAWPTATGVVIADGARVIGSNGKVVTSFGPPQLRRELDRRERAAASCARGARRSADDEIVDQRGAGQGRRRCRSATQVGVLTAFEPKKQDFTLVGIFGYSGGRDSHRRRPTRSSFTTPVAQQLMLGEPDVFSSIDVQAADGVVRREAARRRRPRALGAGLRGEDRRAAGRRDAAASLKEGLSFFNNDPARLRRGGAVRGHLPDPQHVLDHRGAADPGAGADAGHRAPAAGRSSARCCSRPSRSG